MLGVKKVLIGTAAAASVGAFVFGRDMCSYVRTGAQTVRESIKREVPVEFQIERAKEMVKQLTPEIHRSLHAIAREEVTVEGLEKSIAKRASDLESQQEAILSLSGDLKTGATRLTYSGRHYSVKEVQKDLSDRFNRFKILEETLQRERDVLTAKEKALTAHRQKLEGMLSARKDLEVEIERLQARLQSVQAAESMSNLQFDDSALNRAKSLVAELNKELEVRERVLNAEGSFTGLIPVESKSDAPKDIAEQVENYFGKERTTSATVASAESEK
jgi:septal ring factor EnvC (AmiA/AmiB activator)